MVYSKEYKQKIAFEYPCYICGSVLSKARQTINHVENAHGYRLHPRAVGHRRPENPNYAYINDPKTRSDFEVYHCSCPSCWFHCPCDEHALIALANHVNETHKPQNVDASKNDDGRIRDPQVNYVARNKILPDGSDEEKDELEEEDEEMRAPKARARPKNKKKDTNQLGINEIYQKVVDLTEMFKYLMNNEGNNKST